MRFMNEYEIARAVDRWADHPILGPATRTLDNLMIWTNSHSDGWPYWPKPARAAAKLMELIERDGALFDDERTDVTEAEYRAALRPIKAFRTRQNADFAIVEVGAAGQEPPAPAPVVTIEVEVNVAAYLREYGADETAAQAADYTRALLTEAAEARLAAVGGWAKVVKR